MPAADPNIVAWSHVVGDATATGTASLGEPYTPENRSHTVVKETIRGRLSVAENASATYAVGSRMAFEAVRTDVIRNPGSVVEALRRKPYIAVAGPGDTVDWSDDEEAMRISGVDGDGRPQLFADVTIVILDLTDIGSNSDALGYGEQRVVFPRAAATPTARITGRDTREWGRDRSGNLSVTGLYRVRGTELRISKTDSISQRITYLVGSTYRTGTYRKGSTQAVYYTWYQVEDTGGYIRSDWFDWL
ncbi:hypothetical protein ACIP5Y_25785 [Nocardia sp. NPDC088792]|uniref:hypothetical protein n=1 Tax=Nocardia sp. NPDC088792 TaxID=3364332 RepID=UPI0037F1072A